MTVFDNLTITDASSCVVRSSTLHSPTQRIIFLFPPYRLILSSRQMMMVILTWYPCGCVVNWSRDNHVHTAWTRLIQNHHDCIHTQNHRRAFSLTWSAARSARRLRVVPLLLSPSCVTRKKTTRKKMAARNPGGQKYVRPAPRISRGHFFLAVYLRSRSADKAKEWLLVA